MNVTAKLNETVKGDLALAPQSLASTSGTGAYHCMAGFKRAKLDFFAAAMAATKTVVAQVMEAVDNIGTSAAAISGATATITANTKVKKALVTAATIADGATVVTIAIQDRDGSVTSQAFTCEDTDPDASAGEFASGANDAAACVNLAAVINALLGDYVHAVAGSSPDVVTLNARENGKYTMTVTSADATAVISTLEADGFVEIDGAQLSSGCTHIALKVTTDATITCGGWLERGGLQSGGEAPGQVVAASKVL